MDMILTSLLDNSSYKQKKQALDKKRSGSSHNWNSLFLGHNAVAEAIANSHGVSKEDILTPHENDAAVRLALGETKIVATTRKFLEDHGVILDTFANVIRVFIYITSVYYNLLLFF